jgi:very-long-chain enoyl-CoA reductase
MSSHKLTRDAAPKQPIKNLPETLSLKPETPVEAVKIYIAKKVGIKDHNRIGLFDPTTKKTLKDRKATIASQDAVIQAGELLVKDLGEKEHPLKDVARRRRP